MEKRTQTKNQLPFHKIVFYFVFGMIFHFLTLKCNASFSGFHSMRAFGHKVFIASFSFLVFFFFSLSSNEALSTVCWFTKQTYTHFRLSYGCHPWMHNAISFIIIICTALSCKQQPERAELPFGKMHFRNCKIATASQQDRAGGRIQIWLSIWFIIFKPFFRNWGRRWKTVEA